MDLSNPPPGFDAIAAVPFCPRQVLLRPSQFPFPGPIVSGCANLAAVGAHQKIRRLQNHVETDCLWLAYGNFGGRHLELDDQGYKPASPPAGPD
jgi:hypothetical protein